MALERYEMQIHKSEFKPLSFDNSFKLEIASSFNGNTKKHFENILSSIDTRLSDWDERPTLDDIKKRIVTHKNDLGKPDFNKEIRFGGESEILLWKHINICLNKIDYILIDNNNLFSIKRH